MDRAAGALPTGDEDIALFDRVHQEYQQFWTETGRPKMDHGALERDLARRSEEVSDIERQLDALQRDVERVAALDSETNSLVAQVDQQQQRVNQLQGQLAVFRDLEASHTALLGKAATADTRLRHAAKAVLDRHDLVSEVEEANTRVVLQAEAVASLEPDLVDARAAHDSDATKLGAARRDCDEREELASRRRNDVLLLRDRAELARLSERLEAARAALTKLGQAQQALGSNHVDEPTLRAIRAADLQLRTLRAQLEGSRPVVRVVAGKPLSLQIDGTHIDLATGAAVERPFAEQVQVAVPGQLELRVTAGAADPQLLEKVSNAEAALAEACRAAQVEDFMAAEQAAAERRRIEVDAQLAERSLAESLGASTLEELSTSAAAFGARVEAYTAERPPEPTLIEDLPEAERQAIDAEAEAASTRQVASDAERLESASRERLAKASEAFNSARAVVPVLQEDFSRLQGRLVGARGEVSDEALAAEKVDGERAASDAQDAALAAQAKLDEINGPQLATLAENAGQVLDGMRTRLNAAREERLGLIGALRERGQDGLAERLDAAITARDLAARTLASYERKAAARKVLYEALRLTRDEARSSYVKPLAEQVDVLGRVVFGPTFHVDIDESLEVVSRTLDRKTIPIQSLSGGAKEQLAVIVRLACGQIVTPGDGGVPIIFDDVLGFTDPERREMMGAVLSEAGRTAQVIIFTCDPDRYRQVGGAHIVRIN